jgi:hypothetical protein
MGANYYLRAWKSGDPFVYRHFGKDSAGWVFALRIYPEKGIDDLDDWISYVKRLREDGYSVKFYKDGSEEVEFDQLVDYVKNKKEYRGRPLFRADPSLPDVEPGGNWDRISREFS